MSINRRNHTGSEFALVSTLKGWSHEVLLAFSYDFLVSWHTVLVCQHLGISQRKFKISQTIGLDGIQLLSRNTKFIPKSEQILKNLAPLGYKPHFLNVKIQI
jgi:hypothetical protein